MSIFSIVRCKNTWQLLAIAIWKMSMSLLNGITAVHAACAILMRDFDHKEKANTGKAAWWLLLYIPGMFTGMVGLMSLVVKHIHEGGVRKLTISFYCIVGGGVILLLIGIWRSITRKPKYTLVNGNRKKVGDDEDTVLVWGFGGFAISVFLFTVLAAFYSDWALGMMTDNLIGLPSGDNSALFWSYFVAKRLTMFSW
ncbi:hypothetical protein BDQ17DRAFT_792344 [Cyathus striatus]|nr:hypothetical protein BDQ17DRAFT_792344 [Cyathus striatus]